MGSKNLKAVAVRGHAGVRVADMEGFLGLVQGGWGDGSRGDWCMWSDSLATPDLSAVSQNAGAPPSVNPSTDQPCRVGHSANMAIQTRLMLASVCVSCPLSRSMSDSNAKGAVAKSPDCCTAGTLERNQDSCGADGLIRLARLCDDLGLDTVSTAVAIGFTLHDRREGTLDFGSLLADDETTATAVRLIACGEGVGADESVAIRRNELPRSEPGGGSRQDNGAGPVQDTAVRDSLILCSLWHPPLETIAEALTLTTGVPSTPDALREAGNRISKLRQLAADSGLMQEGKDENTI
jgi:aldehyde:ferredoxin oxidoreductase